MIAIPLAEAEEWDAFVAAHAEFAASDKQHRVDIVPGRTFEQAHRRVHRPGRRLTAHRPRRRRKPAVSGAGHAPGMQRAASTAAQRIGDDGEDLVAARLEAAGWTVLARNLRLGRDEVDLLARGSGTAGRAGVVEVRRRGRRDFGLAEETLDRRKRTALRRARRRACSRRGTLPDGRRLPALPLRVDLVAIDPGPGRAAHRPPPPRHPALRSRGRRGTAGAPGQGPCATLPAAAARPRWSITPAPAPSRTEHTRGSPSRTGRCPPTGRTRAGTRPPPGIRGGTNRRRSPSAHRLDAPAA